VQDGWYCVENGRAKGPLTLQRLSEQMASHRDREHLLVWKPGFEGWKEAREFEELQAFIAVPPPVPPTAQVSWVTAFFSFSGRMGRADYLVVLVVSAVMVIVLFVLFALSDALAPNISDDKSVGLTIVSLVALVLAWVRFAASSKRFHDFNRSGFYCLLYAIPVINLVVFLHLIFRRGDTGDNDYGPPLSHFKTLWRKP
jgi:uncharacterized membrane protein YhaH (DUF805 family)